MTSLPATHNPPRTLGLLTALVASLVASATAAHAEPVPETLCAALDRPAAVEEDAGRRRASQDLVRQAEAAYEHDHYFEALVALRAAYALRPLPDVLYDVAQACRAAGRSQEALVLYDKVGAEARDETLIRDAHVRALEVRAQIELQRAHGQEAERLAEERRRSKQVWRRWWLWTSIGGALTVGAAAATLVVELPVQPTYDDLRKVNF